MSYPDTQGNDALNLPRLTLVSGKGGVGKSLVATTIAQKFAQSGRRTALVSMDANTNPWLNLKPTYTGTRCDDQLDLIKLDARLALKEYVRRKMRLPLLYLPVLDNPAVARFLDALPLFGELMCLGKLYDLVGEESPYEQIIFDAPATGHCRALLHVPDVAVKTLVAGPIYDNALKINALLKDHAQTALLIVTLPEETPTREAREFVEFAEDTLGITCPEVIINRCISRAFSREEQRKLKQRTQEDAKLTGLYEAVQFECAIADTQSQHVEWLRNYKKEIRELPELTGDVNPQALQEHLPV